MSKFTVGQQVRLRKYNRHSALPDDLICEIKLHPELLTIQRLNTTDNGKEIAVFDLSSVGFGKAHRLFLDRFEPYTISAPCRRIGTRKLEQ